MRRAHATEVRLGAFCCEDLHQAIDPVVNHSSSVDKTTSSQVVEYGRPFNHPLGSRREVADLIQPHGCRKSSQTSHEVRVAARVRVAEVAKRLRCDAVPATGPLEEL